MQFLTDNVMDRFVEERYLLIVLKREKERTTWLVGLERAKMIGASLSLAISLMISGVNTFKMNV